MPRVEILEDWMAKPLLKRRHLTLSYDLRNNQLSQFVKNVSGPSQRGVSFLSSDTSSLMRNNLRGFNKSVAGPHPGNAGSDSPQVGMSKSVGKCISK